MKYKVGDRVRIVEERTPDMNSGGKMDKYLGTVMTVDYVGNTFYVMKEDDGLWRWTDEMIKGKANELTTAEMVVELEKNPDKVFVSDSDMEGNSSLEMKAYAVKDCLNIICPDDYAEDVSGVGFDRLWKEVKIKTVIDAYHFGSSRRYTWEVPNKLIDEIEEGQIVEVDTIHGPKLVEVLEVYEKEEETEHKKVLQIMNWG